jgi:LacI family transcriptional regulator
MRSRSEPPPGRPTLGDIAAEAGVARATAARALGGYGPVKESTRDRVWAAARKLGYTPNLVARSMVTGRTNTLGFVSADLENPFFAGTMRGILDVARAAGYEVVIANSQENPELERRTVRVLQEHRVDGLLVAPTQYQDNAHLNAVLAEGTPLVLLDRSVRGVPADAVLVDNVRAARAGVERLIELGHRRIGLVTSELPRERPVARVEEVALDPTHASTSAARSVGYLAALRNAGVPVDPSLIGIAAAYTREDARAAVAELLARPDRPTALLTVDNIFSLGAFEAIQASGLDFPGQISLLGFDDLEWTTIVRPRLSVIAQPAYDIGAAAARRLLARLSGEETAPQVLFLETTLIERGSTAPAPASPPPARRRKTAR